MKEEIQKEINELNKKFIETRNKGYIKSVKKDMEVLVILSNII